VIKLVSIKECYWEYETPSGMIEPREKVTYSKDGLDYTIWVYKQYCEVTDGAETATIKLRNTSLGHYPRDLGGDGTNRHTAEAILPLGAIWKRQVVWGDNSVDSGHLLMFLAKTGFLNIYYANSPTNREFHIDGGSSWTQVGSSDVYYLGNIRVRIVKGNHSVSSTRITVSPDTDNKVQIMVYKLSDFDSYSVDELGAVTTEVTDQIRHVNGYYKEIHMRVVDSNMGLDHYMAINPVTEETKGLMVKLFRADDNNHYLFFGVAGSSFSQQFIIGRHALTTARGSYVAECRHTFYTTKDDMTSPRFFTQTFNMYPFVKGGDTTWTFWSIDRITQPTKFKYYKEPTEIFMYYVPETTGDFIESDPDESDYTQNKTVWVISGYTFISGVKYKNIRFMNITGKNGNSVEGGWRHYLYRSGDGSVKYKKPDGTWVHVTNIAEGDYSYPEGECIWAIDAGGRRYFTMIREWHGWKEEKANLTPYIRPSDKINASIMKNLIDQDDRDVNSISNHSMVIVFQEIGDVPTDEEGDTLYNTYTFPDGVTLTDGGLPDLTDPNAKTNAEWDVGYDEGGEPQIFTNASIPTVMTGEASNIEGQEATISGTITDTGELTVDKVGVDWGTESGNYTNEVVKTGDFTGDFSVDLTNLPYFTVIYYRCKAHNDEGWGYGEEKTFYSGCQSVSCTSYKIRIKWDDPNTNELGYQIERKVNDGEWTLIATVAQNETEYVDEDILPDQSYQYRIRAYGEGNSFSDYTVSNTVTVPSIQAVEANIYNIKKRLMTMISNSSPSLQPQEDHVLPNWHIKVWEAKKAPLVTVKITRGRQERWNYGKQITHNKFGEYIVYHFTSFIFAKTRKDAQDLADAIMTYLLKNGYQKDVGILDMINFEYMESEPERGVYGLKRIILEGDIIVEAC